MPYIPKDRRKHYDKQLDSLIRTLRGCEDLEGALTYVIYRIIKEVGTKCRFKVLCQILGALDAAKLEFYRRVVAPYEDWAIERNGDV